MSYGKISRNDYERGIKYAMRKPYYGVRHMKAYNQRVHPRNEL